jgi:glycosyltransferase involved in cell wall biosynthesis
MKECLLSIHHQTFKNLIEIIIVNDGSESNYVEPIKIFLTSLQSPNRKYTFFDLKENQGLPNALNYGLQKCSFDIVARMDSDDIMKPNRIELQYNFMIKNKKCVVVGGQCDIMDENTKKIKYKTSHPRYLDKKFLKQNIDKLKCWFINHPTVMYKKSTVLEAGGYNVDLIGHSEDTYLWIQILKKGYGINNLTATLLTYRDCPNSLSHNFKCDIRKDIKKWVQNM